MPNQADKTRILFVPAELIAPVNQLSARTLARCQTALTCWQTGNYDYLVVSGGRFLPPSVQTVSAGQLMAAWFTAQGVNPDQLVVEIYSLDTFENIRGSVKTLEFWGVSDPKTWDITVVTQWQHGQRFALSFRNMYGAEIRIVDPGYLLGPIEWLKEWAFILIHVVDPFGRGAIAEYNRNQRRLAANGE